mgnify:CR=1 FL=1
MKTGPRSHKDSPKAKKRSQDSPRLKMQNPQNLTVIFSKMSAPNLGGNMGEDSKTRNGMREGWVNCPDQKKSLESPNEQVRAPSNLTATGDRTTEQTDDQLTLVNLLSTDQSTLDLEQAKNGISVHGPSYQGPRTLLVISLEA